MTDVLSKEQRHKNMQNIKGTDSRPEVVLRKALWSKGHRYRFSEVQIMCFRRQRIFPWQKL